MAGDWDKESVEREVIKSLAGIFNKSSSDITAETALKADLGAGSIEMAQCMVSLEHVFNISLKQAAVDHIQDTVWSKDMKVGEFAELFEFAIEFDGAIPTP